MTASKFDELEKRIATLETHVKVAVIVGTFIGVTGSGLVTILWTGFREAKREVDAVEKNAISLDGRIGSLRADIDSNLAVTVDNRKKEIVAFAANQCAGPSGDTRARFFGDPAQSQGADLRLHHHAAPERWALGRGGSLSDRAVRPDCGRQPLLDQFGRGNTERAYSSD